ncbi:MAG: hypothetical protein AAFZ01_14115 [Pseudomonadota bacterium]
MTSAPDDPHHRDTEDREIVDDADGAEMSDVSPEEELEALHADTLAYMRGRVIAWVVRWAIAFAALGVLVWFRPDLAWLWRWAVAIAAVSLIVLLLSRAALQRRMRDADAAIANARNEGGDPS